MEGAGEGERLKHSYVEGGRGVNFKNDPYYTFLCDVQCTCALLGCASAW